MELLNQITDIINQNIGWPDEIKPGDRLKEDLEIDSLDVILIVQQIEDDFGIIVEKREISCLETVQDIIDNLREKLDVQPVI